MTIEHWGKEYVSRTFLVDVEDPASTQEFEGGEEELEAALAQNPNLRAIKRTVPKVKLTIIAGTHTTATLFEGDNPFSTKTFPFIPIMGYFDTGTDRWMYRLSGLIRHMKDPQREKNKRRSLIMETIQKMPQYGYVMDRGAVDDINSLKRKDNLIEKNPGREFREIAPTQIPAAVVTLEQLFDQDIQRIGANPDLLGMQVGREESGVVQSARVRQGLMSNQELFDNTGFAKRILGRQLIEMIAANYTRSKIQRILGNDIKIVPEGLEQQVVQAAEQAEQMRVQVEQEKQALQEDLARLEASGQVLTEQVEEEVDAQLEQLEMQARGAVQQAEQLQAQLAMAKADEEDFWQRFDATRLFGTDPSLILPEIVQLMEIPVEQKKSFLSRLDQVQQAQSQIAQGQAQKDQAEIQVDIQKMQNQKEIELIKQGINPEDGSFLPQREKEKSS
jgi:hypothetical protein